MTEKILLKKKVEANIAEVGESSKDKSKSFLKGKARRLIL